MWDYQRSIMAFAFFYLQARPAYLTNLDSYQYASFSHAVDVNGVTAKRFFMDLCNYTSGREYSKNISVQLVTTMDDAHAIRDELRGSRMIGIDCEGVNLSRQRSHTYSLSLTSKRPLLSHYLQISFAYCVINDAFRTRTGKLCLIQVFNPCKSRPSRKHVKKPDKIYLIDASAPNGFELVIIITC
jgi:hypothetical protein